MSDTGSQQSIHDAAATPAVARRDKGAWSLLFGVLALISFFIQVPAGGILLISLLLTPLFGFIGLGLGIVALRDSRRGQERSTPERRIRAVFGIAIGVAGSAAGVLMIMIFVALFSS